MAVRDGRRLLHAADRAKRHFLNPQETSSKLSVLSFAFLLSSFVCFCSFLALATCCLLFNQLALYLLVSCSLLSLSLSWSYTLLPRSSGLLSFYHYLLLSLSSLPLLACSAGLLSSFVWPLLLVIAFLMRSSLPSAGVGGLDSHRVDQILHAAHVTQTSISFVRCRRCRV